jgi:hypothetical protein
MTTIPIFFFVWGPLLVLLMFWLLGRMSRRLGVVRALETDSNGYGIEDVRQLFSHYGAEGRKNYRQTVLTADAAFAATYLLVGLGVALGLLQRGQPFWVAALCGGGWILGGIADLFEGVSIARLLDRHPALEAHVVARASVLTRLKLWLFGLGIIGVVAGFALAIPRNVLLPPG